MIKCYTRSHWEQVCNPVYVILSHLLAVAVDNLTQLEKQKLHVFFYPSPYVTAMYTFVPSGGGHTHRCWVGVVPAPKV